LEGVLPDALESTLDGYGRSGRGKNAKSRKGATDELEGSQEEK
jgi:hypothetical protein